MKLFLRSAGRLVLVLAASACAGQPKNGDYQLDTLYMFAGSRGAMAYSIDETGSNLPKDYGPWRFRSKVSTSGPTFEAGADKAALEEVLEQGYSVAVFSITIDGKPVGHGD